MMTSNLDPNFMAIPELTPKLDTSQIATMQNPRQRKEFSTTCRQNDKNYNKSKDDRKNESVYYSTENKTKETIVYRIISKKPKGPLTTNQRVTVELEKVSKIRSSCDLQNLRKPVMHRVEGKNRQKSSSLDMTRKKEMSASGLLPDIMDLSQAKETNTNSCVNPLKPLTPNNCFRCAVLNALNTHTINCKTQFIGKHSKPNMLPYLHNVCKLCRKKHTHNCCNEHPRSEHFPNDFTDNNLEENRIGWLEDQSGIFGNYGSQHSSSHQGESRTCMSHVKNIRTFGQCEDLTSNISEAGHIDSDDLSHDYPRKCHQTMMCDTCSKLETCPYIGQCVHGINGTYREQQLEMRKLITDIENKITSLRNILCNTNAEMKYLETEYSDMTKDIEEEINVCVQVLERRRTELKGNLKGKCRVMISVLEKQRKELEQDIGQLGAGREFVSRILHTALPTELFFLIKPVTDQLKIQTEKEAQASSRHRSSSLYFDKSNLGLSFRTYAKEMGQICFSSVYPPKARVETFDILIGNEAVILKLYLYDKNGNPQKDCSGHVQADVYDPEARVSSASVKDLKSTDGCYSVYYDARIVGLHRVNVKVHGRQLKEDGYLFHVKAQGPECTTDTLVDQTEVDATPRKRVSGSTTTSPRRSTGRKIKTSRSHNFPWENIETKPKSKNYDRFVLHLDTQIEKNVCDLMDEDTDDTAAPTILPDFFLWRS